MPDERPACATHRSAPCDRTQGADRFAVNHRFCGNVNSARAAGSDRERTVNFRFSSLVWQAISSLSSNTGSPEALES